MGRIGIIGGSGLYRIEGIQNVKEISVNTPFGEPSDKFITGELEGKEVVFLARHGAGHRILPSEINYRANIYGMKKLGVERIISVSTVGSFKEEIRPLDIMQVDQFVDRTNQARKTTFFGEGIVAHISFAEPTCSDLRRIIYNVGKELKLRIHERGTYLNMEGPAFSTKAESLLYKSWGMDTIGMTNMPEARLAREAEVCFVTIALVTDYDCWRGDVVDINIVIQNMIKNVENVKRLIRKAISQIPDERNCACADALKDAIITDHKLIPEETKKKLDIIIGKYVG
jgi:5'-methylthioadenosine phosphorylase